MSGLDLNTFWRDLFNEDQGDTEYERGYRKGFNDCKRHVQAECQRLIDQSNAKIAALDLSLKAELVKGRG
jgi:hypothetical protein